jgi:NADPH:quinone reductase-like Zn-dependent oxidoreductase
MKAVAYSNYGGPEVAHITEVANPVAKDNEVLIRVHAVTVTAADSFQRKGEPFIARIGGGLTKPKGIPGAELAGEIVGIGSEVRRFKVGDKVFAATGMDAGAHAEFKTLPEDGALVLIPTNTSYAEAAAVGEGALTALTFLETTAKLQSGQSVLINGASGSVGTAAVQIAKHMGAHVTAVCSGLNVDLVRSLGADEVIDYTQDDFTENGQEYDVIFDAIGKNSFVNCKDSLTDHGIYMTTVPSFAILLQMLWTAKFSKKKAAIAFAGLRSTQDKAKVLQFSKELIEAGNLVPVIDRSYPLNEIVDAHSYVDTERKRGNVVLQIQSETR